MKKTVMLMIMLMIMLVLTAGTLAQDYQATTQALQMQIQILELQATIDALQNSQNNPSTGGSNTDSPGRVSTPDMWVWNQQNSGLYATPTPWGSNTNRYINAITPNSFPSSARPRIPTGPAPTWRIPTNRYSTEIYVGDAGQYQTLNEAMQHIPDNAGNVTIYLVSDTEEPQAGVSVPIGKKITSLRITSNNDDGRTVYPRDRSVWFFCNGIPLVIDQTVTFSKMTMIMGGFVTYSGHNVQAPESTIIVNGKAYWVYAGGQSDREGHSSTVDSALVIVNGEVDRVYAGGRAIWGETIVNNSTVIVNGTAKEVYCSGYTENAGATTTVGQANMMIYGWYSKYGLGLGAGSIYLLNPEGCIY